MIRGTKIKGKRGKHPADVHIHTTPFKDIKHKATPEQLETVRVVYERHALSERFHEILQELGDLHDRKQIDYGRAKDPFANVRGSETWGVKPWIGAMLRGNDKMERLKNFAKTGSLANEGADDSFRDLAVYAIIALVLWEEEQTNQHARDYLNSGTELSFDDWDHANAHVPDE